MTVDVGTDLDARLRAAGLRSTSPRRAVLGVLADAGPEHLTAESVGQRAPAVHRATVYRTLEGLAAAGVITHVHLDGGVTAYHLAAAPHLHAQCVRCGTVVDLPDGVLDDVIDRVRAARGFALEPGHGALLGTCAACLATEDETAGPPHRHR